ncbi:MAG: MEDS domain-containing protein, partial [Mycobacteriales bacterium]
AVSTGVHPHHASDGDRHRVAFYRTEGELIDVAMDTMRPALRRGEPVLIIATQEHRDAFTAALGALADAAIAEGRLALLDAQETLAEFMVDGVPDRARFESSVGDRVRRTLRRGNGLCAFGEMVALLWEEGETQSALALEQLWNGLQQRHAFTLLCGYPSRLVVSEQDPSGYVDVGAMHSSVVPGPPVAADAEIARYYPAHAASPRLARKVVRSTLDGWGMSDLGDDAMLVATELATNAVRHAQSDFTLSMAHSPHGVRLAIGDTVAGMTSHPPDPDDTGGRGLQIIAGLARAWGHHPADNGKLVWAELDGG